MKKTYKFRNSEPKSLLNFVSIGNIWCNRLKLAMLMKSLYAESLVLN